MSDWKKLFRENMAADPEFAAYIKGLEPGTPVTPTGEGPRSFAQAPGADAAERGTRRPPL